MKDNHGQTLVLFLFILPIIVIVFLSIYESALVRLDRKKIDDVMDDAIMYGLEHEASPEVTRTINAMFQTSVDGINKIDVTYEDDEIHITIIKQYPISILTNNRIALTYKGTKVDDTIEIVKE